MFWFVIALQVMTPFIHAHAGAVRLGHGDFSHMHQSLHSDAVYHAVSTGEHGAEAEVEHGVPVRHDALTLTDAETPFLLPIHPAPAALLSTAALSGSVSAPLYLSPPDHTLPHALAPPFA